MNRLDRLRGLGRDETRGRRTRRPAPVSPDPAAPAGGATTAGGSGGRRRARAARDAGPSPAAGDRRGAADLLAERAGRPCDGPGRAVRGPLSRGRVWHRTGVRRAEACGAVARVRVMGVDPGLTRCGLGAVEGRPGAPLSLVAVGVVRTPADDDIGARLVAIEAGIERWLDELRPDAVAVERVFAQHNVRTVMGTAQAAAVAILCAARRGLPVALHTPSARSRPPITGSGTADKEQVGAMVTRLLRLDAMPKPADAADALALAICHVWRGGAQSRLAEAAARRQAARPPPPTSAAEAGPIREESRSDRLGARAGDRDRARRRGGRGRRGRACSCTARRARWRRSGRARRRRLATSLVVREDVADPVRLRRPTTSAASSSCCRRPAGSGPRLALAMLAVHTPDALRGRRGRRRPQGADQGARASAARAPQRIVARAQGQARHARGGRRRGARRPRRRARLARPGALRPGRPGLLGAGRRRGGRRRRAEADGELAEGRAAQRGRRCSRPRCAR